MEFGANTLSERWRSMRNAKRADRLDEENDRLRTQLRMTRTQLDRERDRQREVFDALNRASQRKTTGTTKPRVGPFRLVVVAGAAYILGSKAGRQRYDRIRQWVSSALDRWADPLHGVDTSSPGIGPRPNPVTESGVRRAKNAAGGFGTGDARSA